MLPRAVLSAVLALGAFAILPGPAQGCSEWASCPSSCSLELTCPNGCQISCFNRPSPPSVSCSSSCNECSSGSTTAGGISYPWVACDGYSYTCAPYICTQGSTWIKCNNDEVIYCTEGPCT